jgi:hypothetical protein
MDRIAREGEHRGLGSRGVGASECGQRTSFNRTREAGNRDEVESVVAITLDLFRNGAVGFIDWLGLLGSLQTILSSTNKYIGNRGINQDAYKQTDKERSDVHRSPLVKRMLGCADVVKRHQTLH